MHILMPGYTYLYLKGNESLMEESERMHLCYESLYIVTDLTIYMIIYLCNLY